MSRTSHPLLTALTLHTTRRPFASGLARAATIAMLAMITAHTAWAQTPTNPVLDAGGFHQNRAYFSEAPAENIDTMSGALILTYTDLVLPGNGGRDLRFQRTFNSKLAQGWAFGIADIPLAMSYLINRNVLLLSDGSMHSVTFAGGGYGTTRQFWRFDPSTRQLAFPNGRVCSYQGVLIDMRVRSCTDSLGNSVAFSWSQPPAAPTLQVRQYLSPSHIRLVEIALDSARMDAFPTTMSFLGRVWEYRGTRTQGGRLLLESALPPSGALTPGWRYTYDAEMTTTSPHGGVVAYTFGQEDWAINNADGTVTTFATQVVRTRSTRGNVPNGTWEYDYVFGANGLSGTTTIDAPNGTRLTYIYEDAASTFEPETVLRERRVEIGRGNNFDTVETETRAYRLLPVVSTGLGTMALIQRTITRDGAHTTTFAYSGGNFGDYHQPSTITETGTGGAVRTTTRTYTHLTGTSGVYFVGLPASESVSAAGTETFNKAWGYDPATGFRTSETVYGIRTDFVSDGVGNVARVTDPNGTETSFTYEWGLLKDTTTAAHVTTRVINPDGTVQSQTQAGRTTTFEYDDLHRVKRVVPPGGTNDIRTEYDPNGFIVRARRGASLTVTKLDGFGRVVATSNSAAVTTTRTYDAEGRLTFESYPYTGTVDSSTTVGTTTTYDALGRPTSRRNGDRSVATLSYGNGSVTITDEKRRTIVQSTAAFGDPTETRLVALRDANGQTWQYTYDAINQLRSVTAPGGRQRTWVYGGTNRLQSETHPESGTTTLGYDVGGRLRLRTDARGTTFTYAYDGNDRVRSIAAGGQTTTFTYEPGSDLRQSAAVDGVTTSFGYDGAGRPASRLDQLEGNPFRTTFTWDNDDNLIAIDYPTRGASRRRVTTTYDAEHRPLGVRDDARTYASSAQYHPSGAVTGFQSGNGLANTAGYDPQRYWPTSVSAAGWTLTYGQYDSVGNVGRINDSRGAAYRQEFDYDSLDRLTSAGGIYGSISYAYDALGNPQTAGNTTYTVDPTTLRLLQQGTTTFGYDDNGNLTSDGPRTYSYTPNNQVATVTSGNAVTRYAYDADQWRVKKTVPNQPTTYYIRGPRGELLTEWRTNGSTANVKDYVMLGSRLVATVARDYPELSAPTECTPATTMGSWMRMSGIYIPNPTVNLLEFRRGGSNPPSDGSTIVLVRAESLSASFFGSTVIDSHFRLIVEYMDAAQFGVVRAGVVDDPWPDSAVGLDTQTLRLTDLAPNRLAVAIRPSTNITPTTYQADGEIRVFADDRLVATYSGLRLPANNPSHPQNVNTFAYGNPVVIDRVWAINGAQAPSTTADGTLVDPSQAVVFDDFNGGDVSAWQPYRPGVVGVSQLPFAVADVGALGGYGLTNQTPSDAYIGVRGIQRSISCAPAQPDEIRYYHSDAVGSVRVVTNPTGAIVSRHEYRPFGQEYQEVTTSDNVRRFAGKEHDTETGLDYFGARYYLGTAGRFTTVDPVLNVEAALTDPQRWNRYSYAVNRPLAMIDPDGREAGYVYLPGGRMLSPYDAGFPRSQQPVRDTLTLAAAFVAGLFLPEVATACAFSAPCQSGVIETLEGQAGGPPRLLPTSGEIGASRALAGAQAIGGKVVNMPVKTRFGSTDIDVLGPAGEFVGIGGPAKGFSFSAFGVELKRLKEAAKDANVQARYGFPRGTPKHIVDFARERLGAENVYEF